MSEYRESNNSGLVGGIIAALALLAIAYLIASATAGV